MTNHATDESVAAEFEQRVDAFFRAESGKPLVRADKRKPLGEGRGNYVRHYSYSMMAFAARCLYLNEMLDEANAALAENAQHYLDHPKDINDRDSFHWHGEIVLRLIEMYGSNGTAHAGRITPEVEALALRPVWEYARTCSSLEKAEIEQSQTWHVYGSENHHVMDFTINWQFSKLAQHLPDYQHLDYAQGGQPADHFAAWNAYFVAYCRERARKGVCVEMMSNHYNTVWAKAFYNFYDFGDAQVSRSAGMLLDLYLAYWAQEQINGYQGGGGSRVYFHEALRRGREHDMAPLAWLYFGLGPQPTISGHEVSAALSNYRAPAVVVDIARDVAGRGRYEVRQRAQGLGKAGRPHPDVPRQKSPSVLRTDGGGIVRYSYCDPAFIIGTPMSMARPVDDWAAISAQNRSQSVLFAGPGEPRIVPTPRPADNRVTMNAFWSVQSKGCLITQKNKYHKGGAEMIVWLSKGGLSEPSVEGNLVFTESRDAYATIRVVRGDFDWREPDFAIVEATGNRCGAPPGRTMFLADEWSPVIVEVMAKNDIDGFDAFKAKVQAATLNFDGPILSYHSIYDDTLTLDTSHEQTPTINGKPIDFAPAKVLESPFLNADYNSGVVTIKKGERKRTLDFNE